MLEMERIEQILIPLCKNNGYKYIRLSELDKPVKGDKIVTMGEVNTGIDRRLKVTGGTFSTKTSNVTIGIIAYVEKEVYECLSVISGEVVEALKQIGYYPTTIKDNTGGGKIYPHIIYKFIRDKEME